MTRPKNPHPTKRERQVLHLLVEGYALKQVGDMLGISIKTAEKHRTILLYKLKATSTFALVRVALRQNRVRLDVFLESREGEILTS